MELRQALCTIRSHRTKLNILVSKLHSGTSKTKAGQVGLVRVALFWKSHCATCSPVYLILYHVTASCKGSIGQVSFKAFKTPHFVQSEYHEESFVWLAVLLEQKFNHQNIVALV